MRLIRESGIKYDEEHIETWERIKGRGFYADYESLERFSKKIGHEARKHERALIEAENQGKAGQEAFRPLDSGAD